jgi:hypothetical protein
MSAGAPKRLNWKREELVLACDLVMQNNGRGVDHEDPRAIELSEVLRKMKLHPQEDRLPQFRNPNGVAQKTRNLVQHLPGYTGSASRGSRENEDCRTRYRRQMCQPNGSVSDVFTSCPAFAKHLAAASCAVRLYCT